MKPLDTKIRAAQPVSQPGLDDAVTLLSDLRAPWDEATSEERQRLMVPLIERIYVDVEPRCIAAITPTPPFRCLLRSAIDQDAQSICILVEATEEVDWAEWWTWWRRGRVELPVQRRAGLRSYRCVRRLVLVRRAVAGPASPDAADDLRRPVSASGHRTPTGRRRTTARRREACGRRRRVTYAARAKSRSPVIGLPPV